MSDEHYVMISVAAELLGMHTQTLRQYDRLGLVTPMRAQGGGRRYSQRDIERLRTIQRMSQEEGVSLAGIKRIMALMNRVEELEQQVSDLKEQLYAERSARTRETSLVHVPRSQVHHSQAVVVWSPENRRRRH